MRDVGVLCNLSDVAGVPVIQCSAISCGGAINCGRKIDCQLMSVFGPIRMRLQVFRFMLRHVRASRGGVLLL